MSTQINSDSWREREFLGQLNTLLSRSETAYRSYFDNNKEFLYAKILKDNNDRILQLVLDGCHLLSVRHQAYAIDLVSHIDIWSALWEQKFLDLEPNYSDVFVFDNKVCFPKESIDSLLRYYDSL